MPSLVMVHGLVLMVMPKDITRRITHPLHATLDNGVLDAYESCELSGKNHIEKKEVKGMKRGGIV